MAQILTFEGHKRRAVHAAHRITKVVNGEEIECINLDLLTLSERARYFDEAEQDARRNRAAAARGDVVKLR